jgi:hypothetical protein
MLQYTRLNPEDIIPLCRDRCNLAVMTGRTSGNLFVIDCETSRTLQYHEQLLRDAGIPIWAVHSNGKGKGGHLYLRCRDGEVENIKAGQRRDYEIRGNRCYVLVPPSLHPATNLLYQWHIRETPEPPEITLEQLHWLTLTLTHEKRTSAPQPFGQLSNSTRDFLLNGANVGERNNRLFSAACDMAGNGYDQHTATQFLVPTARQCGLTEREIRDTITSAFSKERTPARPTAKLHQKPPHWQAAQLWAQQQEWRGKTGQTDKAVFLACCERAKTANDKRIFRASVREIATLARITRNTASIALQRLTEAKLLIFCGKDRDSGAHLYRLSTVTQKQSAKNVHNRDTTASPVGGDSVPNVSKNLFPSDVAERAALGKTGYALYVVMLGQCQPCKVAVLEALAHLSARQVYYALKRLLSHGLVVKVGTAYQAVAMSNEELDEQVARKVGVLGKGEERRREYQRQRATRAAERLYKARWGATYVSEQKTAQRCVYCPNCGQIWAFPDLEPPLTCDFCGDATTWQPFP